MRKPKIRTKFIILWNMFKNETVNDDQQVRRQIYHKGIRDQEYRVEEVDDNGELQSVYIYKYTKEGPISRKQLYSLWKERIRKSREKRLTLFLE